MTYEQIISKVREKTENVDASAIDGTLAIQVNLTGKNLEGTFYIEVKDGKVSVEPYEYLDRAALVTVTPTNFMKLIDGKMDPIIAYSTRKVSIEGDPGAVLKILKLAK